MFYCRTSPHVCCIAMLRYLLPAGYWR